MGTRSYETTNDKVEHVLSELEILIGWATADSEHAAENDAPGVAKDDLRRVRQLKKAYAIVSDCRREP